MNASVLVGIVPAKLYQKFGPKKTMLIGGFLLTASHILAAIILNLDLSKTLATTLIFCIGVIGG